MAHFYQYRLNIFCLSLRTLPYQRRSRFSYIKIIKPSVADPGCLSRILDPYFSIPGSRIQGQKDSGHRIRIRIKEFKYF
jgi:hypothetical protein